MLCRAQYNNSLALLIVVILNYTGHRGILNPSSKIQACGQSFHDTSVPVVVYFVLFELYFYWVLIYNGSKIESKILSKQSLQALGI